MDKVWLSKFATLCDMVSSFFKVPVERRVVTVHVCLVYLGQLRKCSHCGA